MKVLAIIGSPRRGNTYRITQQVEDQLRSYAKHDSAGEVDLEFDYLFLADANLELCKGCFVCISHGESNCPLEDSRADIEMQILSSDGVILGSPVYSGNVPWLMKNFIDRFSYTMHRPVFVHQKLMRLVTGGEVGLRSTLKALSQTMGGSDLVTKLAVKTPPYKPRPKHVESIARDVDRASRKFYRSLKSGRPLPPSFPNVIWFQVFKAISEMATEYCPADYEFYENKSHFFYETKVNPLKTFTAKLMLRLMLRSMNKRFYMKKAPNSE
jgi:multimeric flavodoxin WrbA